MIFAADKPTDAVVLWEEKKTISWLGLGQFTSHMVLAFFLETDANIDCLRPFLERGLL